VKEDEVRDDGIVLTDREREALAGLAEQIGDPWLARQLAGGEASPPPKKKPLAGMTRALLRLTAGWIGLVLLVAGTILALTTFTRSTVAASLGLALMGFGGWRFATDKGGDLKARWKTAQETRSARKPPVPPRTPPAAA
jgi:hypothetical protein